MDYSLITHKLPANISIADRTYTLDTRTAKALQAYAIMAEDDEAIPFEVRAGEIIELMLDAPSSFLLMRNKGDTAELFRRISDFLNGWPRDDRRNGSKGKDIFSFEFDHALIVAAFRQAYGISLSELKSMHWWEFMALLQGIPDCTVLSRVMGIRSMDIDPKDPPKVKKAKRNAKAAVAITRKGGREMTGEDIVSQAFAGL